MSITQRVLPGGEPYRPMPQSVIDRLLTRHSRFDSNNSAELSEQDIDDIVSKAITDGAVELDLSGANMTGDSAFFVIDMLSQHDASFCHINLNNTRLPIQGFDALMDYFVGYTDLRTLTIKDNGLPKEAGMSLAKLLGAHATLQILDASGNTMGDAGIAAIAGAFTADLSSLSSAKSISLLTLSVLDLSNNNFGDAGLLALCRGLMHFSKTISTSSSKTVSALKTLRLDHNHIGSKSIQRLAQTLQSCCLSGFLQLEELSLSHNPIDGNALVVLIQLFQSIPAEYSSLRRLGMSYCGISVDTLMALSQYLTLPHCKLSAVNAEVSTEQAHTMTSEAIFLDTIVKLSDAVAGSGSLTILTLGDLIDTVRKDVLTAEPGSTNYYSLRIAMDCFRSMIEVLKLSSASQQKLLASVTPGQTNTVLLLQQQEFEKLRQEHSTAFRELSEQIKHLPLSPSSSEQQLQLTDMQSTDTMRSPVRSPLRGSSFGGASSSPMHSHYMKHTTSKFNGSRNDSQDSHNGSTAELSPQDTGTVSELIRNAVANALETAQSHWQNATSTTNISATDHQHLVSRVDMLQEQIMSLESTALTVSGSKIEEVMSILTQLERRMTAVESKLQANELVALKSTTETQAALQTLQAPMEARLNKLLERMTALEASVESEHETSISLLDVLLKKNEHKRKY